MTDLGTALLVFASLAAASATACGMLAGAGAVRYLRPARAALHASTLLLAAACAGLAHAFLAHDFSIRYVVEYSDRSTSLAYLLCGLWGGQEGSLLVWIAMLAAAASAFVAWSARAERSGARTSDRRDGWVVAVTGIAVLAFLAVLVLYSDPFVPMLRSSPNEGIGLNGLLRNPYMALHPPTLFAGWALTAVPAALAVAALLDGGGAARPRDWVVEARPFALAAWWFMTIGNVLGGVWAYEELGWGGYWAWDPVENASLLPWIVSTAYLHAASVVERRGALPRTAAGLAVAAFVLPIFATYLTRSGVVASVHTFAGSPASTAFLLMLGGFGVVGAVLVALRRRAWREGAPRIEAVLSREAGAAATVLLLLLITAAITAATMAPVLSDVFAGDRVVIEPDGYATFGAPLGVLLLLLTAVCPLMVYARTVPRDLASRFLVPGVAAVAASALHLAAGDLAGLPAFGNADGPPLFALATFPLGVFVIVAAGADVVRGVRTRIREACEPAPVAARRFATTARRRIGGNLVHVGLAMAMIGFAGASYKKEATVTLGAGTHASSAGAVEHADLAGYRVSYLGSEDVAEADYAETRGLVRIDPPGEPPLLATPSLRTYRTGSMRDTAEVAIVAGVVEDFYVEMRQLLDPVRRGDGTTTYAGAVLRIHLNPLTWFVWAGSIVLCVGAVVAVLPSRRRPGAARRAPLRPGTAAAILAVAGVCVAWALAGGGPAMLAALGAALVAALVMGAVAVHAAVSGADADRDGGRVT